MKNIEWQLITDSVDFASGLLWLAVRVDLLSSLNESKV